MMNHERHEKHEKEIVGTVADSASGTRQGALGFADLVAAIRQVHEHCAAHVQRTVNVSLTLRNWVIGAYIRQYEQQGADRATYGARLLDNLAEALRAGLDRCYTGRYLGLCRQLFDTYPEIRKSVISKSGGSILPWGEPQDWPDVTWYRKHMMTEGDNPPVGLLLCTQKDHALVEYALAAIDNRLFVSKYQLELPSTEELTRFLEAKCRELGADIESKEE